MKKKIIIGFIGLVFFLLGFYSYIQDNKKNTDQLGVSSDNKVLQHFISNFSDNEPIKCGYEDVNNDGIKDLVVIYKASFRKNEMIIILDKESDSYEISQSVPAPLENQTIEFKNIDEKDEIEFIVSGSKDGRYGYAIFRLEGLEIRDLFGENMDDCC